MLASPYLLGNPLPGVNERLILTRVRSTSTLLKTVVAASAVALSLGLAACSSDDDSSSDASTTTSAETTTAAATSTGTESAPEPAAGEPSAEDLQAVLVALSDPAKPAAEKTALIVNGETRLANLEAMTTALAGYGQITYVVKDVVVTGTTANANVDVTTVHGTGAMPLTWENVDGTWKLSDASGCMLLAAAAPCA